MALQVIEDPIHDPRWAALVGRHPAASVFHSPAWLEALRRTYGFQPLAVTTSSDGDIANGVVLCRLRGWTSRRLVSLPFSDHCDPLVSRTGELGEIVDGLVTLSRERRWGAIELRPRAASGPFDTEASRHGMGEGRTYTMHRLDLRPEAAELFAGFHHSSTRRSIRRAERERLTYDAGRSDEQMDAFFGLLRMARRRHGLLPQPIAWFRNLRTSMGERMTLHLARHEGQPVAAILALSFRSTVVYKYGGSDASRHGLGAMPFLFWQVIQSAKASGAEELDLGRLDLDQPGLIAFKDRLGAAAAPITYYEHPVRRHPVRHQARFARVAGRVFSMLPDAALDMAGRLIYRHFS